MGGGVPMNEIKITGATLVALPVKIQEYVTKQKVSSGGEYFSVYLWLDDESALYLHGNTNTGRTSGGFQGKKTKQIGTPYFVSLDAVLAGGTLQDAVNKVKLVQIDSKTYNWSGTMQQLLKLIEGD
jgi:hypothetical protein